MSRIVVIGANGMVGHAIVRAMELDTTYEVIGIVRDNSVARYLRSLFGGQVLALGNFTISDALKPLLESLRPEVVINCVGLVKQDSESDNTLVAVPINTLFPHKLAEICSSVGARMVQISTDCVFSGAKGRYTEKDTPDALDVYGRSKLLGEVDYPHTVTLRTSTIGHELNTGHGLLSWFLAQQNSIKGYTRAFFSGLCSNEFASVVRDRVLPRPDLKGIYHVAGHPISKYNLLQLVNETYGKGLLIEPDDRLVIDRSLDPTLFRQITGYVAPPWHEMISNMRDEQKGEP
jgi:dTDP-4-dehydrorhamnose reductase